MHRADVHALAGHVGENPADESLEFLDGHVVDDAVLTCRYGEHLMVDLPVLDVFEESDRLAGDGVTGRKQLGRQDEAVDAVVVTASGADHETVGIRVRERYVDRAQVCQGALVIEVLGSRTGLILDENA